MSGKRKFKVKMLARNPDEYLRETKQDIHKRRFTLIIAQSKRGWLHSVFSTKLSGSGSASGGGGLRGG